MCTRHTSRPDACERPYGLRLTSHPIPRAGSASEQKRGRSVRAFGKDRARETQAPARSITAAVPTPLGPPVGCHPTPSDGIAHASRPTATRVGTWGQCLQAPTSTKQHPASTILRPARTIHAARRTPVSQSHPYPRVRTATGDADRTQASSPECALPACAVDT